MLTITTIYYLFLIFYCLERNDIDVYGNKIKQIFEGFRDHSVFGISTNTSSVDRFVRHGLGKSSKAGKNRSCFTLYDLAA